MKIRKHVCFHICVCCYRIETVERMFLYIYLLFFHLTYSYMLYGHVYLNEILCNDAGRDFHVQRFSPNTAPYHIGKFGLCHGY